MVPGSAILGNTRQKQQGGAPGGVALVRMASWLELKAHHPENVMAPLELAYVASLLERDGVPWTLIDTELGRHSKQRLLAELEAAAPRLVAVHGISSVAPLMLELARELRRRLPDCLLLAVGQHASVEPASLLGPDAYHACTVGEYEETVAELADGLPGGDPTGVPGLMLPGAEGQPPRPTATRPLRRDLDALPFPVHHALRDPGYRVYHPVRRVRRIRWGFVLASRGCPYPCTYCSPTLRNSYGTAYRHRSPASVLAEVQQLRELGFTVLHFKDDVFSFDREHTMGLCEALATQRRPLPFTVQTRVDHVDPELFRAMRRAGCTTVSFGIESGSQAVVDRLRKGTTIAQARAAFRGAREAGLLRVGFFLLGSPGETEDDMASTLALAKELDPDILQVAFLTPYPGSALWERIPPQHRPGFSDLSHYNSSLNSSDIDPERLRHWQRRFYREIALRPRFLARYAWIRRSELLWNPDRELHFVREALRFLSR